VQIPIYAHNRSPVDSHNSPHKFISWKIKEEINILRVKFSMNTDVVIKTQILALASWNGELE